MPSKGPGSASFPLIILSTTVILPISGDLEVSVTRFILKPGACISPVFDLSV